MRDHRRPKVADGFRASQRKRRTQSTLLVCVIYLAACQPAPPESDARGNVITIAVDAAPLSIDPRFATDATGSQISELIADGLVRIDSAGTPRPQLALRWTQRDPRHYVFELRRDLRFSDGSPLTAADVKATFDSILAMGSAATKRSALGPIERIDVPDPAHVEFTLGEAFAPFLDACRIGILPAHLIATSPAAPLVATAVIGAGPFAVRSFAADSAVVLVRNPTYIDAAPRLDRAVFEVIPDTTTRLLALQSGSVDLVQNGIEPLTLPWVRRQPHLRVDISPGTTFQYLGLNLRHAPLADRRVRQALALAIDRDAIIAGLLDGLAQPASGMLAPSNWAYSAAVRSYQHDPLAAAQLLDAAGFPDPDGPGPGQRFQLSYKTTTIDLRRRVAEALQNQLAEVGIGLQIQSNEWATFYSDVRAGNFELFSLAWVGIEDPDIYHTAFHSRQQPPAGNNRGGYVDRFTDFLTEQARRDSQPVRRRHLYAKLQRRLSEQLPIVPLWWADNVAVMQRRVHDYSVPPEGGFASLRQAWVEER